ncbi:MAG: 30S ribosomal protein S16 [Planctomycetes bacterium]|jgi:small subunit ribosomal protein S16|nr:30S ribosomal protein S16 [Planctomycetota bacterium]
MLTIKLSKVGKKNDMLFRVIISEKSRDPYGKVLEILGSYNPRTKELNLKNDRVKYWVEKGASMTDTVNNLFINKKVVEGKKVRPNRSALPKRKEAKK